MKPDEPEKPKKRKRVLPRRLKYPIKPKGLDVDLIKLEYLTGGFCGCGHRQPNGMFSLS